MFRPFHKKAGFVTNLDRRGVRDEVERLGRLAEKATQKEMNGRSGVTWTTDHWISSNNETYTIVTAHYIGDNWKLQSAVLDFKVFMEELWVNAYIMISYLSSKNLEQVPRWYWIQLVLLIRLELWGR